MSAETSPARIRVVTAVVLFAVFLAGLATGAAVVYLTHDRHGGHPPGLMPSLHDIDLTSEQRTKVDALREKYRPQLDAILKESFPKVRAVETELNREVRAVLTPEQQKRFDENEAHRPPFSPGGPPPGGPFFGGPPGGLRRAVLRLLDDPPSRVS